MALNDHPQSVPVAICRAGALVNLRALPSGSITCRGRAEPVAIYLVVEETGASVLPASLTTLYAQRHVESSDQRPSPYEELDPADDEAAARSLAYVDASRAEDAYAIFCLRTLGRYHDPKIDGWDYEEHDFNYAW